MVNVRDLCDKREAKMRASVAGFTNERVAHATVTNLTQFEIAAIRQFFSTSIDKLQDIFEAAASHIDA
jgi:hypothetical protein